MSSTVQSLDTPFERLALLPTTMNWLGTWEPSTLYFKNSVVLSPADQAVYILVGAISIVDATDPSTSPLWDIVTPTTVAGVLTLTGSAYIGVDNTDPQNPIVNNTGVLKISAQEGLQAQGTLKNPLIVNTGVLAVGQGLGINITGDTVSNTGVLSITAGADIEVTGLAFDPTIINTGVNSIVAGFNVTISELPTEVAGTAPFISVHPPQITRFLNAGDLPDTNPITFQNSAKIPVPNGSNPNSILFKYINGTPPDVEGAFLFDFSGLTYILEPPGQFGLPTQTGHSCIIYLYDSTTDKTTSTGAFQAYSVIGTGTTITTAPFYINIQPIYYSIQQLKADGLTQVTDVVIYNNYTPHNNVNFVLTLQSSAASFATYFPSYFL